MNVEQPISSVVDEIDEIREAEEMNYQTAKKAVGESFSLVQDVLDLYGLLGDIVKNLGSPPPEEMVASAHFLLASRYQLTLGSLSLLRCHLSDSFLFTRKAIEYSAFAARVKKCPHLARVWLEAGSTAKSYEKYRNKFGQKELFPKDDALLSILYARYDICSKLSHPSIYSLTRHAEIAKTHEAITLLYQYFQVRDSDPTEPIRTLLWVIDTHFGVIRIFERVFSSYIERDPKRWEIKRNAVDAKVDVHKEKYKNILQNDPDLFPANRVIPVRRIFWPLFLPKVKKTIWTPYS